MLSHGQFVKNNSGADTGYLDRAIHAIREAGKEIDENPMPHFSPLVWERINLAGDRSRGQNDLDQQGNLRRIPTTPALARNRSKGGLPHNRQSALFLRKTAL
jgi:hypothetical protein